MKREQNSRQPSHNGLSGPSAAATWSEVLSKQVRYANLPVGAVEEQLRQIYPAWLAMDVRLLFQGYQDRGFAPSNSDVAELTSLLGHAPRRHEDFVRETAAEWKKPWSRSSALRAARSPFPIPLPRQSGAR